MKIFLDSFNKTNSDAILTFIIFENILRILDLSLLDIMNLFTENPNEIFNKNLKNHEKFLINENFDILISPMDIQNEIDLFINELNDINGKCFFKKIKIANEFSLKIIIEASDYNNVNLIYKKAKELINNNDF